MDTKENITDKGNPVKKGICVLGLGVIGTTYAYVLQEKGIEVKHLIRESKRATTPSTLDVKLLDGRYKNKGEEKMGTYKVTQAVPGSSYDFILISVASGKLEGAIETLRTNDISGTLVLFCNLWNDRKYIEAVVGEYPYVMAFPTAGGHLEDGKLDCVLFDHIMLESKSKSGIDNYDDLIAYLSKADIKTENPYDMVEWIWIHMAVNAGVTSTAARDGKIDNPRQLALNLMSDHKALAKAVKTIRETLKVVEGRGVDLKLYKDEINVYKIPACIAGIAMKHLFASNELTRRIMTLHNDVADIMYGCDCVYNEGKRQDIDLPMFYGNMDRIKAELG